MSFSVLLPLLECCYSISSVGCVISIYISISHGLAWLPVQWQSATWQLPVNQLRVVTELSAIVLKGL